MFAGSIRADVQVKDHVGLEVHLRDPQMRRTFEVAGQGKLTDQALSVIAAHTSVVYLRVPPDLTGERAKVVKFTKLLQAIGGAAIKVESAGVAHMWDRWHSLLAGTSFDLYTAAITLVADRDYFYSCGMHNFSLPDCEVPQSLGIEVAAELMNQFNHWQLTEKPVLQDRHTFSLATSAPRYRLLRVADLRHQSDEPFFNPRGLWRMQEV